MDAATYENFISN